MIPLLRHLYFHQLCDGMSVIYTEAEFALEANPFIQRYLREFSREPLSHDSLWQAAKRALLEERPDQVLLNGSQSFHNQVADLALGLGMVVTGPDTFQLQAESPQPATRSIPAEEVLATLTFPGPGHLLLPEGARAPWSSQEGECLISCLALSFRPELAERLRLAEKAICIEPVNQLLEGASASFTYGDYDNEFAVQRASHDLRQLLGEDWQAEILSPHYSAEGLDNRYPFFLLKKGFTRRHWLDRFQLPEAKKLRIVLADSQNIAGSVLNHAYTINRYTDHEAWALCCHPHPFIDYPKELCRVHYLQQKKPTPEVEQILREADCFVFFEDDDETSSAWPFDLSPYIEGKGVVHLYIGWRVHSCEPRLRRPGRQILTPLPHLLRMYPEADFYAGFPPATLDTVDLKPPLSEADGIVRVLQTPSLPHRTLGRYYYHKDTERYLAAARNLKERHGSRVEFWQLGGWPHHQILKARQQTDITFNQLRGYHGLSGDEAMYLERPMVQAFDQFNRNRHREYWGLEVGFPWRSTTPEKLEETLEELILDSNLRKNLGRAGRKFMLGYFSPQVGIVPMIYYCYQATQRG